MSNIKLNMETPLVMQRILGLTDEGPAQIMNNET